MIESEMQMNELSYCGIILEIKGKDFLKIDREKFKLIRLGTKEEVYDTPRGEAIHIVKRWGVVIPKGMEKEFVDAVKDKWVLPDELDDLM